MEWASNISVVKSEVSQGTDGAKVVATCPANTKVLGCACQPAQETGKPYRANGCQHTAALGGRSCQATNKDDHAEGVHAEALCAQVPGSYTWETVSKHAVHEPTNLTCSSPYLHMLSCSCGSAWGQCSGGKVTGGKCQCSGLDCNATARCANIPIPPSDCRWSDWGEWTDCSVSCGNGVQTRLRASTMLAEHGGAPCSGATNMSRQCDGDANARECSANKSTYVKDKIEASSNGGYMIIMYVMLGVFAVAIMGGGAAYLWHQRSTADKMAHNQSDDQPWFGEYGGEQPGKGGKDGWGGAQPQRGARYAAGRAQQQGAQPLQGGGGVTYVAGNVPK